MLSRSKIFSALLVITAVLLTTIFQAGARLPFGYPTLERLLQDGNIDSTEALLKALPVSVRSRYALVYRTRNSAQFASPQAPRVILSNRDSTLLVAMSGDPAEVGFNTLEIIHFDSKTQEFLFKSVRFAGENQRFSDGRGFAISNPTHCVACHHEKPIWDSYAVWPGFYGSSHSPPRQEEAWLEEFKTNHVTGIYQQLKSLSKRTLSGFDTQGFVEHLSAVTGQLGKLNMNRIFNKIRQNPQYLNYRTALLAASIDSDRWLEFLPAGMNPRDLKKEWGVYSRMALRDLKAHFKREIRPSMTEGLNALDVPELEPSDHLPMFKQAFILSKMGIDLKDETMLFNKPALSFQGPVYNLRYMSRLVYQDVLKDYRQFESLPEKAFNGTEAGNREGDRAVEPKLSLIQHLDSKRACSHALGGP